MDRGRVSVLVYHGKPETSVQVRKGQLPRISEATAIGYELRSYRMDVIVHGEVPAACIVLQDRNSWNPDALLNFLEGKLAKFKIPSYMEVFEEFPTLSNGKVDMLGLKRILLERIKETAESA